MTVKRLNFQAPYGCRWCGEEKHRHGRRWAPIIQMHSWMEPSQAMILERMQRRLDARLTAEPAKYHATTAWAPDHTGEEGIPFCADCKTDSCPRWTRIQTRLDQIRWGIPHRTKNPLNAGTGGWGGYTSDLPF